MSAGQDESLRFELGPVKMEFLLEVHRAGGGEVGVRFGVISVGAKGGVSSGSTHRVTLALTPRGSSGRPPTIRDVEDDVKE